MSTLESEFTLRIALGNAEMSRREHLAEALRRTATAVESHREDGPVTDANGNSVGRWAVDYPQPDVAGAD